jgi:predicted nucleic acid-binding protein
MTATVCFLDANVLYSAALRDLLVHLSLQGVVDIRWSDTVHDEWTYALRHTRPDIPADAIARTRAKLDAALPTARVTGYEPLIPTLMLPDANDRHVLAAAITCGAAFILTFDVSDFATTPPAQVPAIHPDNFLTLLTKASPDAILPIIKTVREALRQPPVTPARYLDNLRRNKLPLLAACLATFPTRF